MYFLSIAIYSKNMCSYNNIQINKMILNIVIRYHAKYNKCIQYIIQY